MLSRGKIRAGHARYYTEQVAAGIEDYMGGRREAPGVWAGAGASAEGLVGNVTAEQIERLFEGADARHPLTGEVLGRAYSVGDGVDKVMGWDLTLSAPKSFSVLWAVGGPDLAKVLDQVHAAAVVETVAYLEEHGAFSRTGRAGMAQVDSEGLLIARFEHRTSRAMDPQRHSHLLVSNRVRCSDGVWRSIDSKALHQQLKPAGTIYQAALRAEATARLGVAWGPVNGHGQADIAGVPAGLVELWSKRRRAVERAATALIAESEVSLGRALTDGERRELFQRATLDTRPRKGQETAPESIHEVWRDEAEEAGFAVEDWIGHVLHPTVEVAAVLDPEMAVEAALAELEMTRSTWGRTHAVEQIAARLPAGLASNATETRAWVEYLADRVVNHADVVALTLPSDPAEPDGRRRDGRSVFEPHSASRYTTRFTLELEQRVLDVAVSGRDSTRGLAEPRTVEAEIAARGLSADQADGVRRLCLAGDTLACLVGPAGTGKTRTIGAAVEVWFEAGYPVRGLAVSAVAAEVLAREAGVEADTVAKLLYEHDRTEWPREAWQLMAGEVVVVDEASQLATADLARLVELVDEVEGKLVLLGDHRQLGAVDAGGLFRLLARDQRTAELSEVWRFHQAWERQASLDLRDGDPAVLGEYERHGRLVAGSREEMLDRAYRSWVQAREGGESMVVMAGDHRTVDSLAMRIRAARVQAGEVEPGGIEVGEQTVGKGDEIVTLRNDRRLLTSTGHWVRNGDRWRVDQRDHHGGLQVDSLDRRGRIHLPASYAAEHVALSYAVTLHKAQGVTVDHGIVLVDETTSELGLYVGMTRGRHTNHALVGTETGETEHGRPRQSVTAREVQARVLQRDTAERSATEILLETVSPDSSRRLSASLEDIVASFDRHARRGYTGPDVSSGRFAEDCEVADRIRRGLDTHLATVDTGTGRYKDWWPGRAAQDPSGKEVDLGVDLP